MKLLMLLLAFIAGQRVYATAAHRNHQQNHNREHNESFCDHVRMHEPLQKTKTNIQTRSIGGENAEITSFPYTISLRYDGYHICGGSILNKNYIITAAHCTYSHEKEISHFFIRAGSSFLNTGGIEIGLSEIIEHENFDLVTYDYDVAVLKLESSLIFSDSIQPIPLATSMPPALTICDLTGWGSDKENNDYSNQLQLVKIPISSMSTCCKYFKYRLTNRMFCAGTEDKNTCTGDGGGPFVLNGTLVGIVSFAEECPRIFFQTGYQKIPVLADWILSKTTEEF